MTATIEAPRMNNRCMPRGAVAIVSIDPVASVAALDDVQATLEASALPHGKYLAIVDTLHGFDWSKPVYDMPLGLSFFCVGRGLPAHPEASLALSPGAPLSNDRPHMIIDPPLPWPDCYVYTLDCFYARISRVHPCAPPRTPTVVTEEQWVTINSSVTKDQMSADLPLRDVYGEPMDIPDDDCDTENEPSYDVKDAPGIATNDAAVAERQTSGNHRAPEDQSSDLEHAEDDYDPHETWPRLEAWLDLTSTTEFDQPAALLQTLRRLTIIVHESKRRRAIDVLAKQPRTLRWAENVAAADGVGDLECPDDSLPVQAMENASLGPEDPIEHRRERATSTKQPTSVSRPDGRLTRRRREYRMPLFLNSPFDSLRIVMRRLRGVSTRPMDPK